MADSLKKIQVIEFKLVNSNDFLVVIDDLLYNTENGCTQFYDDLTKCLRSKRHRVRHIGKKKIDKINRSLS